MRHILTSRRVLVWALIAVILIGLVAVWQIQRIYLREFDPDGRLVSFMPDEIRLPASSFIQILDLSCPCNGFSREHIASLVKNANQQGLVNSQIWVLNNGHLQPERLKAIAQANHLEESAVRVIEAEDYPWIPATPAALISNSDGTVAYFGPFSSGIRCNTGNSFIDSVIQRIETGNHVFPQVNAIVDGCFCPWPGKILN
ncbi:DUF6436 domain-containing protein [Gynuella sunshinyii]|uniref:DUF6436 domain-containing protein n=1 Tax=Gynuella sunshinyii YC6258 TaxID=1445510 RepID=A0A0C5V7F4_9GAMM|nr:DUF6436 domain-containing protein [Gynuella sunshinyii]AJQ95345.1 hypothetical Protein YC6258_03309 [Gynuella sunshinyii YC6258]